jgi:DNA primase
VKNSMIARGGKGASRRIKEMELAALLWEKPDLAVLHGEILAALPFADRSLDRLRHELLNLAASGGRLETRALENHLVRVGLTELAEHLARRASGEIASASGRDDADRGLADAEDVEARWLRAAHQLREIAELDPERARAVERFRNEASEDSWRDVQVLLERRTIQGE